MNQPVFRTMEPGEVGLALDWARAEGWNPGLDDAAAFGVGDPNGFMMAEVAGQPAAVISVVNHTPDLAFLGLYIAQTNFRGQGIGIRLWTHAVAHAGSRTIGLDGVPDQQSNYRKSAFVLAGETYRFTGLVSGHSADSVRAISTADIPALAALEARASGYAKPAFLQAWLTDTESRRTLVLDMDGVVGFVTVRACDRGHKIGPLVASSVSDAEVLIRAAVKAVDPTEIIIDVPDDCSDLMNFCASEGMTVSFNTARMYRGPAPTPGPGQRAVATLELG